MGIEDEPEVLEGSIETRLWSYCVKAEGHWWNYIFPTHEITDLYEKLLRYPSIVARNTVRWKDHEAAVYDYNYVKRLRAKRLKAERARRSLMKPKKKKAKKKK